MIIADSRSRIVQKIAVCLCLLILSLDYIAEPLATSHLDNLVNHGYLAVNFFFLLSGYVIGYAYDDRWGKLTIGGFLRRRFERLQPLVILGMTLGAITFYFTDSTIWPLIHTVPVWKLIIVMLIGYTILPYALLTFSGTILLAYTSLKWHDEPVRSWLRKKLK